MRNFIEDYLSNPSQAIASAAGSAPALWCDSIDEEMIYKELATGEFRLYQEIVYICTYDDRYNDLDDCCGSASDSSADRTRRRLGFGEEG